MNQTHALADAAAPSPKESGAGQYLAFTLQDERYGVALTNVREIIGYAKPTPVPTMPSFMLGVINLRGHVVPVIDLARRFGTDATQIHPRSGVVILETAGQVLGVVVDAVNSVLDLSAEQIEPAPSFGAGVRRAFLQGMAKTETGFTVLLAIGKLFMAEEFAALAQTAETTELASTAAAA